MAVQEPVAVLSRAIAILNVVTSENGDIGIRGIARTTGIHSATVHRIVSTLQRAGILQQDELTALYRPGPVLFTWGSGFLRRMDLRQIALPHMRAIRDEYDETVTLSIRSGLHRVYLEQLPSNLGVRTIIQIGSPYELVSGAAGTAMLSALSDTEIDSVFAEANLTNVAAAELRHRAFVVRVCGYATSQQEVVSGVTAVAAPVTDAHGTVWCISLLGPSARVDTKIEQIGSRLQAAAAEIGRAAAGSSITH